MTSDSVLAGFLVFVQLFGGYPVLFFVSRVSGALLVSCSLLIVSETFYCFLVGWVRIPSWPRVLVRIGNVKEETEGRVGKICIGLGRVGDSGRFEMVMVILKYAEQLGGTQMRLEGDINSEHRMQSRKRCREERRLGVVGDKISA